MAKLIRKEFLPKAQVYDVTVSGTHSFFAASRDGFLGAMVLAHNCHRMGTGAQDVLLKPLEEGRMIALFCTTEPEKIRKAIRSRCEEHTIRTVTTEDVLVRMRKILEAEKVTYDDEAVRLVIDSAGGHVRDVIKRLEGIAQVGPISMENVRGQLNLSLITLYYDVLLGLATDLPGTLALLDRLLERASPEEIATGLAEAAMNSFRAGFGMVADFTHVTPEKCRELHARYGPTVVRVADYFLRNRYHSQVSLVTDLVSIAQSMGVTAAPPVTPPREKLTVPVLHADIPAEAPKGRSNPPPPRDPEELTPQEDTVEVDPTPQDLGTSEEPTQEATPEEPPQETPLEPAPTPTQEPNTTIPLTAKVRPTARILGRREDGIGNLGKDPLALTEDDDKGVPVQKMRDNRTTTTKPSLSSSARDVDPERKIIPPAEWRRLFSERWLRSPSNG